MSEPIETAVDRCHAPVLIMGSPRSGTTFLSQMINRFFNIHICRDNGTLLRFHSIVGRYQPLTDDANLKRLISSLYKDYFFRTRLRNRGLHLDEDELFQRINQRTYGEVIRAVFSAIAEEHGKQRWGYKRASFARVEGRNMEDLFPGAKYVHIIRDARDVVLSMRNTPNVLLERSWHFAAADWVSHVQTGRLIGRTLSGDRYLEVRYERLMADPATVLTQILTFCGTGPGDDERLARIHLEIGDLVRGDNTEKWRRLMRPASLRTVERVAGPLLSELGYPLAAPEVSGKPVTGLLLTWLYADRIVRNLFTRNIKMMLRYRLQVLSAHRRARLSKAAGHRS